MHTWYRVQTISAVCKNGAEINAPLSESVKHFNSNFESVEISLSEDTLILEKENVRVSLRQIQ